METLQVAHYINFSFIKTQENKKPSGAGRFLFSWEKSDVQKQGLGILDHSKNPNSIPLESIPQKGILFHPQIRKEFRTVSCVGDGDLGFVFSSRKSSSSGGFEPPTHLKNMRISSN